MTKTLPLLLLLLTLVACAPTPAPEVPKNQDAAAELKPVIERVLAGWTSLDPKNSAPFYAKEAGLTFYDIAPLKYVTWAEYEAGFQKIAASWKSLKLSLNPDLQATRNGNIAWASYTVAFEIEPKEGAAVKGDARSTNVFEKRGNDWIIIHEHVSVPMPEPPTPVAGREGLPPGGETGTAGTAKRAIPPK